MNGRSFFRSRRRSYGKTRIGFENNRLNADGQVAANNAERVTELVTQAKRAGFA